MNFLKPAILFFTIGVFFHNLALIGSETISSINSFDEIPFNTFNENDCLALDLDETTFIQVEKIMRNINLKDRVQFLKEIREKAGDERVTFTYDNSSYRLVENKLLFYLNNLNDRNIETVAFTVRRTGKATLDQETTTEEHVLNILKELNIAFKSRYFQNLKLDGINQNNLDYQQYIIDKSLRPYEFQDDAMVKEGVIFSNNIDKGLVLGEIFTKSGFFPETFILVDDKVNNLKSVEEAINSINKKFDKNIRFKGYLYNGHLKLDSTLNSKVVALQKDYLLQDNPKFISEEEALELLNKDSVNN